MFIKFTVIKFIAVNFANIRIIGKIIQGQLKVFRYISVYTIRIGKPDGFNFVVLLGDSDSISAKWHSRQRKKSRAIGGFQTH